MATAGAAPRPDASDLEVRSFLMTDIEGSTRLWEGHGDAMPAVLDRLDALLEGSVAAENGRVIRSRGEGDSSFAVFTRTSDAIAAALDLQRSVEAEPWPEAIDLKVRMAIHTGEAVHRFGDFFGPVVNRCARIRAVAHGGQILLSQIAAELATDRLPVGATLEDLGSHRLRDVRWPERLFQLTHHDLRTAFPPLTTIEQRPDGLPAPLTSLVGRQTELRHLAKLLSDHRLVTLSGTGGVGKTRLAVEAATRAMTETGRPVQFVDLSTLNPNADPAMAVAAALGLPGEQGRSPTETVIDHLSTERLLLVLDNCEHVVGAAAVLASRILDSCADIGVLATSREVLHVDGESIFDVRPLVVGGDADEAVSLFADRAALVAPDFNPTADDLALIGEICTAVDGLPLAVELAAARTRSISLSDLARRITGHLALLTSTGRATSPRQRTIRALIEWSYDLLSEGEQLLFRRMSIFAGCARLDHVADVCRSNTEASGSDAQDDIDLLDTLAGLVDKSLVVHDTADGCYRLLMTTRSFATDRLHASGEAEHMAQRHWDHFLAVAQAANAMPLSDFMHTQEALDLIHPEVMAALARAIGASRVDVVARYASNLADYWEGRGRAAEVAPILERAVDAADEATDTDPADLSAILRALAQVRFWLGDLHASVSAGSRAVEQARRADAAADAVRAPLVTLANVLSAQGVVDEVTALRAEARALAEAAGDHSMVLRIEVNEASGRMQRGDMEEPRQILEAALARADELGDLRIKALAAIILGSLESRAGQRDAALARLHEATELSVAIGDQRLELGALTQIAATLVDMGLPDESAVVTERAVDLAGRTGMKRQQANLEATLGAIEHQRHNLEAAASHIRRSIAGMRAIGDEPRVGWSLHSLATVKTDAGEPADAIALCEEALEIAERTSDDRLIGSCHRTMCRAYLEDGDAAAAVRFGQLAVEAADRTSDQVSVTASRLYLAEATLALGEPALDLTLERLRDVIAHGVAGGDAQVVQAHRMLADLARDRGDDSAATAELQLGLEMAITVGDHNAILDIVGAIADHVATTRGADAAWPLIVWALGSLPGIVGPIGWADNLKVLIGDRPLDDPAGDPPLDEAGAIDRARQLVAAAPPTA